MKTDEEPGLFAILLIMIMFAPACAVGMVASLRRWPFWFTGLVGASVAMLLTMLLQHYWTH